MVVIVFLIGISFLAVKWGGNTYALDTNSEANKKTEKDMTLNQFRLLNNNVYFGEKIFIDLDYNSTDKIIGCSLWLKNTIYGNVLYYSLEDFDTKPYIFLDNVNLNRPAVPGEYQITGMTCFFDGFTGGGNKYFSIDTDKEEFTHFDFGENIVIKPNDGNHNYSQFKLYDFELLDHEVSVGDTVNAFLSTNIGATSIMLSFYNKSTNDVLPVYLKGMEKRFFVVPSTAISGEYILQYIQIKDSEHSYILLDNNGVYELYEDGILTTNQIDFNLNQTLKINDIKDNTDSSNGNNDDSSNNNLTFLFNSEDYNESIKKRIMNLDNKAIITVIADRQTLIQKSLFEAIQETGRTLIIDYEESEWVFNGTDIKNPKDIDVAMLISDITTKNFNTSFVSNIPSNSKLLTFSNNGELPGKVLIRLKSIELDKIFGEDSLYIYYYVQDKDKLDKVAMEIQKNYGYYEFYINHNSDYILTTTELVGNYVSNNKEALKLNTSNETTKSEFDSKLLYIIGGSALVVILVITIVLVIRKKKNS